MYMYIYIYIYVYTHECIQTYKQTCIHALNK